MNTAAKRALFVFAALAFLALGPAVVLYAWGYRYNFDEQRVDVTGILYVKSYPRRASVLLNGQLRSETTPAQLTGLKPEVYRVSVEREGMWTWTKELPVTAQRVTFAEDVVLFRRELVLEPVAAGAISDLSSSPDGRMVATVGAATSSPARVLTIRDAETGAVATKLSLAPGLAPYQLLWSASSRRIAVIGSRQALALAVGNAQNPILIPAPTQPWLQLQWERGNDNGLLSIGPAGVQRFDLATRRWASVSDDPVVGLRQSAAGDVAAYATGSALFLAPWPAAGGQWRTTLATGTDDQSLVEVNGSGNLMLWRRGGNAWLVDAAPAEPLVLRRWTDATQATWSPTAPTLAVVRRASVDLMRWPDGVATTSAFELPQANARVSWYPGGTHLYLATPGTLAVAEVDGRGERNVHTLLSSSTFAGLSVPTSDSATLYWVRSDSSSSTASGLYRATVQ